MTTKSTPPDHRSHRPHSSAIALSLLPLLVLLLGGSAHALQAGDLAPDFSAPSLNGKGTVGLAQHRGKIVYLDFWASWCAPCLKAIPEMEKLRAELPADSFQIVAVNLDQKTRKALRFLEKNPIGYPSASDPKGRLPGKFGLETMPTSYLIDRKGVIRYVHPGFKKGDGAKLRDEITALIREK